MSLNTLNTRENIRPWDETIQLIEPNAAPMISMLETMTEEIGGRTYNWTEDKNFNTKTLFVGAFTSTDTLLKVKDINVFENDQIISHKAEKMLVTVVNPTTTEITVTRGYMGTTAIAIADEEPVYVVGSKSVEGSDARSARHTEGVNKSNHTQIFKQSIEITGSQLKAKREARLNGIRLANPAIDETTLRTMVESEILAEEELKKINVLAGEMENALIFGKKYESDLERYAGGLYDFIQTNVVDGAGSLPLTIDLIDQTMDNLDELGAFDDPMANYVLYVSPAVYKKFKNMQETEIEKQDNAVLGALKPLTISTTKGSFPIISHRRIPSGDILIVNLTDISLKTFRELKQTDWNDNGRDAYTSQMICEKTFQIKNEEKMARLLNLKLN